MIKTVIFDIGNVIFNFDIDKAVEEFTTSEDERNFIKNEIYHSPEWCKMGLIDLGYISLEEAALQIKDRTNRQISVCLDTDENSYTHTRVLESIKNPENTVLEFPIAQLFQKY